ncbi:MAG: beta-lactamase family protein [Lachnospiraceae bacterium]|nr:beta-lactamase family protein [Lachnospiraceae bacterium]
MLTFEKALPEETGIPVDCIGHFIERLNRRHIPMHSLLIMHNDKLIFEGYYEPCRADSLHRMFSISKSFTSIAIGLLVDEGKISLDDPIIKYFPEKLPPKVHPWIASMTIRNMLMMRTCHASTTYKLNMNSDWVESFFTTPPTHPAGTIFHYDTSAAHTLCALVEKLTGEDMLDYIKKKLGILGLSENSYMLKDPFGVSIGGSGLVALPMDLMKFGYFIAHKGMVDGKQLISSSYIDMAVSCLTETQITAPVPSEAQGYGLQFWRGEKNGYTCYGMGGQLIIFLPDYDLICVTTADTQNIGGGNQQIYDALYEELLPYIQDKPLPVTKDSSKLLEDILSSLKIEALNSFPMPASAAAIIGKDFRVITENSQFDSFCLNIDQLGQYDISPQSGTLSFVHKNTACTVNFGIGCMKTGIFPIYDLKYCASGAWLADGTFYIKVHIIDSYVGSLHFQLSFGKDDLTIFMRKKEESLFKEFEGHLYCKS